MSSGTDSLGRSAPSDPTVRRSGACATQICLAYRLLIGLQNCLSVLSMRSDVGTRRALRPPTGPSSRSSPLAQVRPDVHHLELIHPTNSPPTHDSVARRRSLSPPDPIGVDARRTPRCWADLEGLLRWATSRPDRQRRSTRTSRSLAQTSSTTRGEHTHTLDWSGSKLESCRAHPCFVCSLSASARPGFSRRSRQSTPTDHSS